MFRLGGVLFVWMIFWVQPAPAIYYTYSEWAALPEVSRTMFMTGAYDSLERFPLNVGHYVYPACRK